MKRTLQLITLVFGILLLCGCENWDDVASEYEDVLKTNPNCTYTTTTSGVETYIGFKTITFYASTSGISVSYDNGAKQNVIDKDVFNNVHYLNDLTIYYNDFDLQNYLNNYRAAGTCPTTIYACQNGSGTFVSDRKVPDAACTSYKSNKTSENSGSDGKSCVVESASECEHQTFTDYNKRAVYLEVGLETTSSGGKSKYFAVSYDNFKTAPDIARESTGGLALTTIYGDTYMVQDETIFASVNGKFPTIKVRYTNMGMSMYYYLYNQESPEAEDPNLGDFEGGTTTVTPPKPEENADVGETNTDITEVNLCSPGSNALKAFQIIGYILFILKIVVPLILIIMASVDFAKAVISSSDKPNAELLKKLFQRVLIGVIIFVIPTVLNFLLSLVDGASETVNKTEFTGCTDCLLDPFGDCEAKNVDE